MRERLDCEGGRRKGPNAEHFKVLSNDASLVPVTAARAPV